jgi:hypothetical protein
MENFETMLTMPNYETMGNYKPNAPKRPTNQMKHCTYFGNPGTTEYTVAAGGHVTQNYRAVHQNREDTDCRNQILNVQHYNKAPGHVAQEYDAKQTMRQSTHQEYAGNVEHYNKAPGHVAQEYDAKQTMRQSTHQSYGGNAEHYNKAPGHVAAEYDAKQTMRQSTHQSYGGNAGHYINGMKVYDTVIGSNSQDESGTNGPSFTGATYNSKRDSTHTWNRLPAAGNMNINLGYENALPNSVTNREQYLGDSEVNRPLGTNRQSLNQNYLETQNASVNSNRYISSDNHLHTRLDSNILTPLLTNPFANKMLQSIIQ